MVISKLFGKPTFCVHVAIARRDIRFYIVNGRAVQEVNPTYRNRDSSVCIFSNLFKFNRRKTKSVWSTWGDVEEDDRCGDCGCAVGQQHFENCDIERCPACGLQFISCDCGIKYVVSKEARKNLDKLIKQQEQDNIEFERECEEAIRKYEDKVEQMEKEKENKKQKRKKSEAEM